MKTVRFALILVAAAVLAGCGREPAAGPYSGLPESALLLAVGDYEYDKAALEADIAIMNGLLRLSNLGAGDRASADPKAMRKAALDGILRREVLVREAGRRGITVTEDELDEYQERFAARCSRAVPLTIDDILVGLGPQAGAFRENMRREALAAKVQTWLLEGFAKRAAVTREDAVRVRQEAIRQNDALPADNRALARLATNSWRSVRAGNDFAVVGRKLQELRKEISFEEACDRNDSELARLAAGELSPLLLRDGEYVFAKALKGKGQPRRLALITFRLRRPQAVGSVEDVERNLRLRAAEAEFGSFVAAWTKDGIRRATVDWNL